MKESLWERKTIDVRVPSQEAEKNPVKKSGDPFMTGGEKKVANAGRWKTLRERGKVTIRKLGPKKFE